MANSAVVIQLPRDINKLCRTCMKALEDEEAFEHHVVLNSELTELSKMLESVTSLKIEVGDGLPETVCTECSECLSIAYFFKNQCALKDRELRDVISRLGSDVKPSLHSLEQTEPKQPIANITTQSNFVCHVCLATVSSNYELSKHQIDHNINKTLSERFKDSRHEELKPVINMAGKGILDRILERKLYTFTHIQDATEHPLNNENHDETGDDESSRSKSASDVEYAVECECNKCGMLFQSELELDSHMCDLIDDNFEIEDEINNSSVFKCPLCFKNHPNMVSLSIHFLKHAFTHDVAVEPCFCEICGQLFDNQVSLEEHYQESTCPKEVWICSSCNIQFETESLLLIHNSLHMDTKSETDEEKVACVLCDEQFLTKENLLMHALTHLTKKYMCKECCISFCTQQAYFQHLKLHPGYQYTCIICGQLAKTKNALKCHVIGVHSEGPSYTCKVCNKSFKTPGRLKTHSHIHEEQKDYMCSFCGYASHKAGDLQIHIRSHTSERPYKCTFSGCTMKFKTSSHLCSHVRRHLNIRNFTCPICNVRFGTRHSLKIHHMLHTGEKPHNCIICGHKFRRKYHLKVHMKQHEP